MQEDALAGMEAPRMLEGAAPAPAPGADVLIDTGAALFAAGDCTSIQNACGAFTAASGCGDDWYFTLSSTRAFGHGWLTPGWLLACWMRATQCGCGGGHPRQGPTPSAAAGSEQGVSCLPAPAERNIRASQMGNCNDETCKDLCWRVTSNKANATNICERGPGAATARAGMPPAGT